MKQFKRFMGIILTAGVIVSMTGCTLPIGNINTDPDGYEAVKVDEIITDSENITTAEVDENRGRGPRDGELNGLEPDDNGNNDNLQNGDNQTPDFDYSYSEVLTMYKDYFKACANPDYDPYENEEIPMGVAEIVSSDRTNNTDTAIGYLLKDISGDNNPELIIGTAYTDDYSQEMEVVLAIYGMSEDGPVRLVEGWFRNSYYILEDNTIFNTGSSGAGNESILRGCLNRAGNEFIVSELYYTFYDYETDEVRIYRNLTGEYTYNDDEISSFNEDKFYDIWDGWAEQITYMVMTPFER